MLSDYTIMPVEKMFDDISDIDNQMEYQDEKTMAIVYRGNSDYYYLTPAVGALGIKAKKEIIDSIISSGHIPIEDKKASKFEKEVETLKNISGSIDFYFKMLNERLQLSLTTNTNLDEAICKEINKKVKALTSEEAYENLLIPLGVVIGEIVRLKIDGEWHLNKKYGYNPYYIPYITKGSNNFLPWHRLADMLVNKKFDIILYIDDVSKARSFFKNL